MKLTKTKLNEYLGKEVRVELFDGKILYGVLGFTPEFSAKYNYMKPNYYTIKNWCFKVSHIKSIMVKDNADNYNNKQLRL